MTLDIEHRLAVAVEHLSEQECRVTCGRHDEEPFTWTGPPALASAAIEEHVGDDPSEPAG